MKVIHPLQDEHTKQFSHADIVAGCKNLGIDLECGCCASLFFTGYSSYTHTCWLRTYDMFPEG